MSRVALRVARKKGLVSAQEVSEWENRHGISCQDLLAEGSGIEGEIYLVDDILNFAVGAGGAGLAMREYLQAGGYDGVLYGNGYEGVGEDCAVVFKAEQIEVLKVAGVAHFKQRALSVF